MEPLIICAAVTGGGPAKARSPHHPVTPEDIARSATEAWRAGAAVVHCHARLADGTPSNALAAYRDLRERLSAQGCGAVVTFSAGDNGGRSSHEERLGVIEAGADIVSLGGGAFNIADRIYDNPPAWRREMARRMQSRGIKPEFEIFDVGQIAGIEALVKEGLVKAPHLVMLVFGVPGGMPTDIELLRWAVKRLPAGSHWSVSCQTSDHAVFLEFMLTAFALGGNIRTGMEDFVHTRPGELATGNAELVAQWVDTARIWGRPLASPADARRMLGLAG